MTDTQKPFPRIDGRIHCGPFPVRDLAGRFGTPLYLYDFDFIRSTTNLRPNQIDFVAKGGFWLADSRIWLPGIGQIKKAAIG